MLRFPVFARGNAVCKMGIGLKKRSIDIRIISVAVSVILAVIDQITKSLAVQYIKPVGSIPLIQSGDTQVLNLTYCENTGMSFSMLEGHRFILILLPVLLIGLVEWYIFSGRLRRKDMIFALAALAGGGLGNLIDRVLSGYVVDFIDFRIINFAIFNFADICAVCGGIYFGIAMLIDEVKNDRKKEKEEPGDTRPTDGGQENEPADEPGKEPENEQA